MEDDTAYSLSVAGNIHPSDSQMNAITSISQGHDTTFLMKFTKITSRENFGHYGI